MVFYQYVYIILLCPRERINCTAVNHVFLHLPSITCVFSQLSASCGVAAAMHITLPSSIIRKQLGLLASYVLQSFTLKCALDKLNVCYSINADNKIIIYLSVIKGAYDNAHSY